MIFERLLLCLVLLTKLPSTKSVIVTRNYRMTTQELVTTVVMETTTRSIFPCLQLCDRLVSCVTINFYQTQSKCHLLGIPSPTDVFVPCSHCQSLILSVSMLSQQQQKFKLSSEKFIVHSIIQYPRLHCFCYIAIVIVTLKLHTTVLRI